MCEKSKSPPFLYNEISKSQNVQVYKRWQISALVRAKNLRTVQALLLCLSDISQRFSFRVKFSFEVKLSQVGLICQIYMTFSSSSRQTSFNFFRTRMSTAAAAAAILKYRIGGTKLKYSLSTWVSWYLVAQS